MPSHSHLTDQTMHRRGLYKPEERGDWVLFHPVYTPSELKAVKVLRHEPENMRDRAAALLVKALRCVSHSLVFPSTYEIESSHILTSLLPCSPL
jgi:hypothetical protein